MTNEKKGTLYVAIGLGVLVVVLIAIVIILALAGQGTAATGGAVGVAVAVAAAEASRRREESTSLVEQAQKSADAIIPPTSIPDPRPEIKSSSDEKLKAEGERLFGKRG